MNSDAWPPVEFEPKARTEFRIAVLVFAVVSMPSGLSGVDADDLRDVLSVRQWDEVDTAVDRGLVYLAGQQRADGAIAAPETGQPGITSLAVMAFLSRGHVPEEGPYGTLLIRAIDFVRSCQREDGLLAAVEPEHQHVHDGGSHTGNYNHAISALMLSEVYGMLSGQRAQETRQTIDLAIRFSRAQQTKPRGNPNEQGGWRYLRPRQGWDADISVSSWHLMFYRSAKNNGFDVPVEYVDDAMAYIRRGFDPRQKTFAYNLPGGAHLATRGVVGGAIVSLSLGGEHHTDIAKQAGDWILKQSFRKYNQGTGPYHYGAYYCSQAMWQLGGEHWKQFFPPLAGTLLANQAENGSWDPENDNNGDYFGRTYTTSLAVLALTPANQLLPIYQR